MFIKPVAPHEITEILRTYRLVLPESCFLAETITGIRAAAIFNIAEAAGLPDNLNIHWQLKAIPWSDCVSVLLDVDVVFPPREFRLAFPHTSVPLFEGTHQLWLFSAERPRTLELDFDMLLHLAAQGVVAVPISQDKEGMRLARLAYWTGTILSALGFPRGYAL